MEKTHISSFLIFLLYRLSSVFIIKTHYVPDEYWQSLEVAHNMAFGYGYLTWEWKHGLRSYLYPSCFAFIYKCLEFFHIDFAYLLILVPKLLQAILTALSDQCFLLLCRKLKFDEYWANVYLLTNWFWYYCGCRTITNTFETSLSVIAFYYFPWNIFIKKLKGKNKLNDIEMRSKSLKYMTLSAINCIVRPTAVTIWGPLVLLHLTSLPLKKFKQMIVQCVLPVFVCVLSSSILIDFIWYGNIIIPPYNFLVFNIVKNVSAFYGTHPFYWYITEGLPAMLGLHLLPFVFGFILITKESFTKSRSLLQKVCAIWMTIIVINIAILSNIPHKEFRFALPLLPLMMLIAVKTTSDFFAKSKSYKFLWTFLLVLAFIIPTAIFGIFHQQGPLTLMNYLSSSVVKCTSTCSFLFLMPCHSTPLYSHLHVNVSTKFLTCEPPLTENVVDESDEFFNDPIQWLHEYWNDKKPPSHVALFDSVENSVRPFLTEKGFAKMQQFFHTFFPEKNTGKYIVVYEQT